MKKYLVLAALAASTAHAGRPFECMPRTLGGDGGWPLLKSATKGDFAAWRCPSGNLAMAACTKSQCSLVTVKRGVAAFLNAPSLETLNQVAGTTVDPFTDPAIVAVWLPFKDEINSLKK